MLNRMFLLRLQSRGEKLEHGQFIETDKFSSFSLIILKVFPLIALKFSISQLENYENKI